MNRNFVLKAGICMLFLCLFGNVTSRAAELVTEEGFEDLLQKTLKKNPDLILNILREHSEDILDIAQDGANYKRAQALQKQWAMELDSKKEVNINDRPVLGPRNATVTIVAFSDFTCPYCYQGFKTIKFMMKKYDGKIRYVFKNMPLGKKQLGYLAAEYFVAASFQGEYKAWKLYDAFFEDQEELLAEGEVFMKKAAQAAGLDMEKLASDRKGKKVERIIDEDLAESNVLRIQGTPFFLVNNLSIRGALDPENFEKAILMALEHKK